MELIYTIGIIIFAIAGVSLTWYIIKIKNKGQSLICPLGKSCDSVVHGRFSKFFGIKNEIIGLLYYVTITLVYVATLIFNVPQNIIFYILLVSSLAFIFNIYLVFVQLILLKKWCTTCLGSFIASADRKSVV